MDTFPIAWQHDAHHRLVGLVLPEHVPTEVWRLRGGLGFQGVRPTALPAHARRDTPTLAVLVLGPPAICLGQVQAGPIPLRAHQGRLVGACMMLAVPLDQAPLLEQWVQRWSRGDLAVLPALAGEPAMWAIASRVRPQVRTALLQRQRADRRLDRAADRTGVPQLLQASGLPVRRLTAHWDDPHQERGIVFHLEPSDPQRAQAGVYRPAELRSWARGQDNPVVPDPSLRAELARHEGLLTNLMARLEHAQIPILRQRAVWMGQAVHRQLGFHLVPAPGHEATLPEGTYSWRALQNRFPLPPPTPSPLGELRQHLRRVRR